MKKLTRKQFDEKFARALVLQEEIEAKEGRATYRLSQTGKAYARWLCQNQKLYNFHFYLYQYYPSENRWLLKSCVISKYL